MDLQQLLRDACEGVGNDDIVSFRNDYSGRGMYGQQCVGIVGTHAECMLIIGEVIKNASTSISGAALDADRSDSESQDKLADVENDFDILVGQVLNFSQDDMGMATILYWPALDPIQDELTQKLEEE